jgi:hypothetical protein
MPEGWRFRSGFSGTLVLQCADRNTYEPTMDEWPWINWHDAKVEDMHRFFEACQALKGEKS